MISEVSGRFSAGTLDPQARRAQLPPERIPGHHAIANHLDEPVDWTDEFRAEFRDRCDLVEHLAKPAPPPNV